MNRLVKERNVNRLFAFWAALLCAALVSANEAKPEADDPALERRVMNLSVELRCLVCQNQTIADSSAPLAVDLRNQIRDQLKRGATEREVTEFMVARYGDFVLYRPPFKATTLFLWLGPFVLLALGLFVLIRRIRARRALAEPALSDAERVRAARLLDSAPE